MTTILTGTRKAIIDDFKKIALLDESVYGKPLTAKWRKNLLTHFRSAYRDPAVDEDDITRWIEIHKWISEPSGIRAVRKNSKAQKNVDPSPSKSKVLNAKSQPIKSPTSPIMVRGRGSNILPAPSVTAIGIPVPGPNAIAIGNVSLNNNHQHPDIHDVETDIEFIDAEEETVTVSNHEGHPVQEQLALTLLRYLLHPTGPGTVFAFLQPNFRRIFNTRSYSFEALDFERLLYGSGPVTHERFIEIYDRFQQLISDFENMDGDDDPAPDGLSSFFLSFIQNTQLHHAGFLTGDDDFEEGFPGTNDLPEDVDLDIVLDF